jgi:hypothetical protein
MNAVSLKIDAINTEGGTQSRATINDEVVDDYTQIIREGADFPPVVVFFDGKKHWLADGFHRLAAYRIAGATEIAADVRQGTRRDAILYSVGANGTHGLHRTRHDKRRAVLTLLSDSEWSQKPETWISETCRVSRALVRAVLAENPHLVEKQDRATKREVVRNGTTYTMDTANIGRAEPPAVHRETEEPKPSQAKDEQTEFDRQREASRDHLPEAVKQMQQRKAEAIAARRGEDDDAREMLAELEELREANASLEAEVEALKAENAKYGEMRVQFEQGGFEKVIAGKDEEIRVLLTRIETESKDKASWKRSADFWKTKAEELGYGNDVVIDIETGDVIDG